MAKGPDRLTLVKAAVQDEIERFNLALSKAPITIDSPDSLHHGHRVVVMKDGFWLVTEHDGSMHTWAYCNDGRWAKLLQVAGVARNPLFA